jgi:hypothetical protein
MGIFLIIKGRTSDQSDKDDKITTIKILMSTRDKLARLGTMDDNYDTVINRLIKEHEGKAAAS